MEPATLRCKRIANRMLGVLISELHPKEVEFVVPGTKIHSRGVDQYTVDFLSEDDSEVTARQLSAKVGDINGTLELLLPDGYAGVVITAANVSLRVVAFPISFSGTAAFRADILVF